MGKRNRESDAVNTTETVKKEAEKTAQSASKNAESFFKRKQALIREAIEARKNGEPHSEHHEIIRHL